MMKSDATHYDFSNVVALITRQRRSVVQLRVASFPGELINTSVSELNNYSILEKNDCHLLTLRAS